MLLRPLQIRRLKLGVSQLEGSRLDPTTNAGKKMEKHTDNCNLFSWLVPKDSLFVGIVRYRYIEEEDGAEDIKEE